MEEIDIIICQKKKNKNWKNIKKNYREANKKLWLLVKTLYLLIVHVLVMYY